MAAQIITITEIGASGTNIKIKVNDGHPIPDVIIEDSIQKFSTWPRGNQELFFTWTDDNDHQKSMIVPQAYIGWVMSSLPVSTGGDRFRIDSPCQVSIDDEVINP